MRCDRLVAMQYGNQQVYVIRSEIDNGHPGYKYEDEQVARERCAELNDETGVPSDHEVFVEERY